VRFPVSVSLAVFAVLSAPAAAQQAGQPPPQVAAEHEVKAAYLVKFLPFIEWPAGSFADAEAPIAIGVLGSAELADELEALAEGSAVQGRAIEVRRLKPGDALDDLQVLFVGRSQEGRLAKISGAIHGRPILVVSESPGALDEGSMVNFLLAAGRVRFEVSLDATSRAGLRISSRMLSVATNVRPARP
jgi:hypothetical protein